MPQTDSFLQRVNLPRIDLQRVSPPSASAVPAKGPSASAFSTEPPSANHFSSDAQSFSQSTRAPSARIMLGVGSLGGNRAQCGRAAVGRRQDPSSVRRRRQVSGLVWGPRRKSRLVWGSPSKSPSVRRASESFWLGGAFSDRIALGAPRDATPNGKAANRPPPTAIIAEAPPTKAEDLRASPTKLRICRSTSHQAQILPEQDTPDIQH